jgi:predicted AlkP superfamily phosphohydrolase/phosphomutase
VSAARIADSLTDWRLMIVQFQTLDALQHRCWHLLSPGENPAPPPEWIAEAQAAMRSLDECLGELLELADRRGAAVVAISDHGFGAFREKISLPVLLARRNLLRLPDWHSGLRCRAARLAWKAQRRLHRWRKPGASTASLQRPCEALLPVDFRRSVALAFHGSLAGLVYLNTPQRFGRGPVTTPRLREQAAADVIAAFEEARHPQTGEPLFDEVYAFAERFGGDPLELELPDVVAIPAPGFHTRVKLDRGGQLLLPDAMLTGTHRPSGVLMIRAPQVVLGRHVGAELRDAAPTILHLLGMPPTQAMAIQSSRHTPCADYSHREAIAHGADGTRSVPATGCVLNAMFSSPAESPVRLSGVSGMSSTSADFTPDEQRAVESRLRDLGYLD